MRFSTDTTSQRRSELSREAARAMRPPRILLAEDDDAMRCLLTELLAREGYEVIPVSDGFELLEELATPLLSPEGELADFDVVVSDVRMPGCTGIEVLRGLRQSDWQAPFVFITAFGDDATHSEAYRLGAYVFDKPFDPRELLEYVETLVPPTFYREGWSRPQGPRRGSQ